MSSMPLSNERVKVALLIARALKICVAGGALAASMIILGIPNVIDKNFEVAAMTSMEDPRLEFFEKKVRPLLVDRCLSCHGTAGQKQESGLNLTHREGLLTGGQRGPAVIPGDAAGSLLISAVRGLDQGEHLGLKMPPEGEPLSVKEISVLEQWIEDGLVDPRTNSPAHSSGSGNGIPDMELRANHWSFQAMAHPQIPEVNSKDRIRQDLDAFVLAQLESLGWQMAPEASTETLARRLSQGLTGLPISWDRLIQLRDSENPEALGDYVEELLASEAFGERWARWWLDLARYSDSNGLDENLAYGEAWRFRDYVIRSFNQDKPYDRFLTEQLAGDLLPQPDSDESWRDQRTATAFLALGPKMLAEQDKDKLAIDVVDEQLDVAGQTFLGMTIGCARCHDHKFDPVTARDYYAMAGIFRSTSTFEDLNFVSRWREISLETATEKTAREVWQKKRSEVVERREKTLVSLRHDLENLLLEELPEQLLSAEELASRVPGKTVVENSSMSLGLNHQMYGTPYFPVAHTVQSGMQQVTWHIEVLESGLHDLQVRYTALESRPMKLFLDGELLTDQALKSMTGTWSADGLRWESQAKLDLSPGIHEIQLVGGGQSVPHIDRVRLLHEDLLAEVQNPSGVLAWVDFLRRPSTLKDPLWGSWARSAAQQTSSPRFDGEQDFLREEDRGALSAEIVEILVKLEDNPDFSEPHRHWALRWQELLRESSPRESDPPSESLKKVHDHVVGISGPWYEILQSAEQTAPEDLKEKLNSDQKELVRLDGVKPPDPQRSLGVQDGEIVNLPVHIRGSHLRLAQEEVPRGFMGVIENVLSAPEIPADKSGRLELANWMTREEHPLTARVLVNRVWLELFGDGLVATPSNFGLRGDAPSHPELLDHLARDFIKDGWSIKKLIRKIVDSSAWRQQVVENSEYQNIDPENRWLWSQNRQRLRAESVRDAVLFVSGQLDQDFGGTLLMTPNRGYVTNDQSNNQARYDVPRRSIYLPVIRNAMYELFSAFDYNDPSIHIARRPSTVVPHQALYFLNSPMVIEASGKLITQVFAESEGSEERVRKIYQRVLCRNPDAEEIERAHLFLENAKVILAAEESDVETRVLLAWQSFCQTLIAASEFLYLD